MVARNLGAIILTKPESIFYVTGFNATIWSHPTFAVLGPESSKPDLLVNGLRIYKAEHTPGTRINHFYGHWFGREPIASDWPEALEKILAPYALVGKQIGIEQDHVSLSFNQSLEPILGTDSLTGVDDLMLECRNIKDKDEVESARIAAAIASVGLTVAREKARAGESEQETFIAAKIAMYNLWIQEFPNADINSFGSPEGGKFDAFDVWVLFGDRKFMQATSPTSRVLAEGETGSLLLWVAVDGRHVELEDTVWRGELPIAEKKAIGDANEIRKAAVDAIRPGVARNAPYKRACDILKKRGYSTPGRIGHNVGLGPHEGGSIDGDSPGCFTEGMIVAIEPNATIPGFFKTQISRTYLVTRDGCECLTPELWE